MKDYASKFKDMNMWSQRTGRPHINYYPPSEILPKDIRLDNFIFLGIKQPIDKIDYERALKTMDRLLPIYWHIEENKDVIEKGIVDARLSPEDISKKKKLLADVDYY